MLALLLLLAALLLLLLTGLLLLLTALATGLGGLATYLTGLTGTAHHHLRNCTRGRDGRGRHFLPVV